MGFSSSAARRGDARLMVFDGFGCNKRSSRAACGAGAKNEAGQSQNSILVWIGMDMNGHTEDG